MLYNRKEGRMIGEDVQGSLAFFPKLLEVLLLEVLKIVKHLCF
jgi:hypothetical protein